MGDLRKLLNPKTVALIGATDREGSVGRLTLDNLLLPSERRIYPVNPKRNQVLGLECYANVGDIPEPVDLAIIATPAHTVPELVDKCGQVQVGGIVIVSAGFRDDGAEGRRLEDEVVSIRNKYGMPIIGPNCMGFIRPHLNLSASFLPVRPEKGKIAFISQSGAFGRALLDWGMGAHIGFSMFASLGSMIDVDFAGLIDFLSEDPYTRSIMIYVEGSIGDVRKFSGAAKAFARNKPIIVLKPLKPREEPGAPLSHTGTLIGKDQIYDAVFKRIGMVRVRTAAELFSAASVLYSRHLPKGPRLFIVSNSGGVAAMAANTHVGMGGELARISDSTLKKLDSFLPPYWNRKNPVDLLRDADPGRFGKTMAAALDEPEADGLLVVYTPQGTASSEEVARSIVAAAERSAKPVIAIFMGGQGVEKGKEILAANNIPTYDMPEEAVSTYLYMYRYERNIELLYETPAELPVDAAPPKNNLKAFIRRALKEGTTVFTEEGSGRFLINYGIPVMRTQMAASLEDAVRVADRVGYPVVLKVSSPDLIYRVDVGGVITGISSKEELIDEYAKLMARVKERAPDARITGVTVQKMMDKIDYEVILGAKRDPEFGTVILFGAGGVGVQIFKDFSIGLPPLSQTLARQMMEETRIFKALKGYRGKPAADLRQLEQIIVSFSNLIVDFPEIAEMDINPIAIADGKAYALDARIIIDGSSQELGGQYPHLIIAPYPTRYITTWTLPDGTSVILRPIKPEDEPMMDEMYSALSDETFRARFFQSTKRATHEMHIRQCSIDYDREMGIVAETRSNDKRKLIGIGTLMTDPGTRSAEYAVLVHDDVHGKGLGYKIMDVLIGIAQDKSLDEVYGYVLSSNRKMLNVCTKLGFTVHALPDKMSRVSLLLK